MADATYHSGIKAAHEHNYPHEEALAHELYGIFCVRTHNLKKGLEQLTFALNGYQEWGAIRKVNALQLYIDQVQSSTSNSELQG